MFVYYYILYLLLLLYIYIIVDFWHIYIYGSLSTDTVTSRWVLSRWECPKNMGFNSKTCTGGWFWVYSSFRTHLPNPICLQWSIVYSSEWPICFASPHGLPPPWHYMTLMLSRTFREVRSVAKRVGFVDADAAARSPRAAHHQRSLKAQVQQWRLWPGKSVPRRQCLIQY